MPLPDDYAERVYAGVLGKVIGVYLGRPFEQWPHDRVQRELGEIRYYVHEQRGVPLVVADDDITGTFTFLRALRDHGISDELTAGQVGLTWLNYLIEGKTILWWGGMGRSTEHTAYLRLKHGVPAPRSGSAELNSRLVAEQIGAQIFIDGWGLVCPGEPERAARFARTAASVSHDGVAIDGAVVVASLVSQAFVESDLDRMIDRSLSLLDPGSLLHRVVADLRQVRRGGGNWRDGLRLVHERYSYERFGGGCHMVPNHALVMLALLFGDGDFQASLMIVNTAGYDTDCNSGNVGCILGVRNGLSALDAGPDWRAPFADRMLLPTADAGRCLTDAAREALEVANVGRLLHGEPAQAPKHGARFHFELPGSQHGFLPDAAPDSRGTTRLRNIDCPSVGSRCLAIEFDRIAPGRPARALTPTFLSPEQLQRGNKGYALVACPSLYPGQTVHGVVHADPANPRPVQVGLCLRHYDPEDKLQLLRDRPVTLEPSRSATLEWTVPDVGGQPVADVGIEITSDVPTSGCVQLDWLDWRDAPRGALRVPERGDAWRHACADGTDFSAQAPPGVWTQNEGLGLVIQGTRDWRDYRLTTVIDAHLARRFGLAARVQGMRRFYAVLLTQWGTAQLVRWRDTEMLLAEVPFPFEFATPQRFLIEVRGGSIRAEINDRLVARYEDRDAPLLDGAAAVVIEEGRLSHGPIEIEPR